MIEFNMFLLSLYISTIYIKTKTTSYPSLHPSIRPTFFLSKFAENFFRDSPSIKFIEKHVSDMCISAVLYISADRFWTFFPENPFLSKSQYYRRFSLILIFWLQNFMFLMVSAHQIRFWEIENDPKLTEKKKIKSRILKTSFRW